MSINEFNNFGFVNDVECLPKFDKFDCLDSQRALFLNFYNSQVEKEFRFTKEEILKSKKWGLKRSFIEKINSFLHVNFTPQKVDQKFYFDLQLTQTLIRFQEYSQTNTLYSPIKKSNDTRLIDLAYRFILLCFDGVKLHIKLNGHKLFSEFVYNKIKIKNQDKKTSKCENCIDIVSVNETTTKVFTFWQLLNRQELHIDEAISNAVEVIKNTNFNQIYLVYPKHEKFDKHIQIKIEELEACRRAYEIKVIPYSLRSILR